MNASSARFLSNQANETELFAIIKGIDKLIIEATEVGIFTVDYDVTHYLSKVAEVRAYYEKAGFTVSESSEYKLDYIRVSWKEKEKEE